MGLQLPFTTEFGIELTTAYAKIISYRGDKNDLKIEVAYFATQAARDEGKPILERRWYSWSANADAFTEECYTHLKTLADFAEAEDVIDPPPPPPPAE